MISFAAVSQRYAAYNVAYFYWLKHECLSRLISFFSLFLFLSLLFSKPILQGKLSKLQQKQTNESWQMKKKKKKLLFSSLIYSLFLKIKVIYIFIILSSLLIDFIILYNKMIIFVLITIIPITTEKGRQERERER